MIPYDDRHYQPPAPVATLTLRTIDGTNITVANVVALVDTGADVTLLPLWAIEQLGLQPKVDDSVQLAWFDETPLVVARLQTQRNWVLEGCCLLIGQGVQGQVHEGFWVLVVDSILYKED